ncbi:MAG: hypothetical protein NC900_04020 [Candidatus Omnitrophica bacterium]|nr:hypothetical protein [Candidatus Omnitrophota bacterium]
MNTSYQIDDQNNLLIKRNKQRLVPSGIFKITPDNKLLYLLNEPQTWCRKYNLGSKIVFCGRWGLDRDHNLTLDLSKDKSLVLNKPFVLKGEILSVDSDALSFLLKSYDRRGISRIQILKLKGTWTNDEYNRLNFLVEKKTSPDTLIFKNAWQVNPYQQIIYTYHRTDLKTKTKILNTIGFDGFWQITSKDRLRYILNKGERSYFDFYVQLESPNLYPQQKVIKYRIGIGLKKEIEKIICLYGSWRFSRRGALSFEMDYGKAGLKSMEFAASLNLNKKEEIVFSLHNLQNQPLGISLIFSHKFLKDLDAQVYLKLKEKLSREKAIETGISIPF